MLQPVRASLRACNGFPTQSAANRSRRFFSRGDFQMRTTHAHRLIVSINSLRHRDFAPQLVNDRFHVLRFTRFRSVSRFCPIHSSPLAQTIILDLCFGYVLSFLYPISVDILAGVCPINLPIACTSNFYCEGHGHGMSVRPTTHLEPPRNLSEFLITLVGYGDTTRNNPRERTTRSTARHAHSLVESAPNSSVCRR